MIPPDDACERAGILLAEELGGWVTLPEGETKIVVGKRRRTYTINAHHNPHHNPHQR